MPNLQSDAEKQFYNRIGVLTNAERAEIGQTDQDSIHGIQHSLTRGARLSEVLNSYGIEIEDNLSLYETNKTKTERLNRYLKKANEHEAEWTKEKNKYIENVKAEYWKLSAIDQQLHVIRKLINKLEFLKADLSLKDTDNNLPQQKLNLASIFNAKNNSFDVCKSLMEDLEITIDGINNSKRGRIGKLTGLITAIKETPGMLRLDNPTEKLLLDYFNSHLSTTYTTFSKRSEDYNESLDTSKRYIRINFKK